MRIPLQRVSKRIRKRSRMGQSVVPTKKKKTKNAPDTVAETIALVVKGKFAPKTTIISKKNNVGHKNLKVLTIKKQSPVKKKPEKFPKDSKKPEKKVPSGKIVKKVVAMAKTVVKKEKKEIVKKVTVKTLKKLKKIPAMETALNATPAKQEDAKETVNHANNNKARGKIMKEPKNCGKKPKTECADAPKQMKGSAVKRHKSPPKTAPVDTSPEKMEKQKKPAAAKEKKLDNKVKKDETLKTKKAIAKIIKQNSKSLVNETKRKNATLNVVKVKQEICKIKKEPKSNMKKCPAEIKTEQKPIKIEADALKDMKPKKRTERRIKTEDSNASADDTSSTSDEITLDVLRQNQFTETETSSTQSLKTPKKVKVKVEQSSDTERNRKPAKARLAIAKKKVKPKMVLIKKRILAKDKGKGLEEQRMRRMKLFGFWTGPKRHRVASLNALAKVHCLYENETRGALMDMEAPKPEPTPKAEKKAPEEPPPPKRNLRSGPGMRGIGKHWDMHDTSSTESSSEDNTSNDSTYHCPNRLLVPPPSYKQKLEKQEAAVVKKPEAVTKRRRNRTEIIMDLKDMVVRKRMASLNASAILAASYSVEKRAVRSPKTEDTDETTAGEDSSDVSYKKDAKKKCYEADVKSEDDVGKVCVTPNKKVAVILNQDTDVTITGVYVNSTTRSTHHEGYCSIAGMQYRISATSHTQTAATAVATETLLHHSTGANTEHVSCFRFFVLLRLRGWFFVGPLRVPTFGGCALVQVMLESVYFAAGFELDLE